jgi:hypothetical protein
VCFRRQGLDRCYVGEQKIFLVGMMLGQKHGSRIFFANRELVITTSGIRQEWKNQLINLTGLVKAFKRALVSMTNDLISILKRALVPISHRTQN